MEREAFVMEDAAALVLFFAPLLREPPMSLL